MKKALLVIVGILVPLLFAINILRMFYADDGTYVGVSYLLQRLEDFDLNSADYIYAISELVDAWQAVSSNASIGEGIADFFVALFATIALPVQIIIILVSDIGNIVAFIVDVLGFYPGAGAVGG